MNVCKPNPLLIIMLVPVPVDAVRVPQYQYLKRQCHEISDLCFFQRISTGRYLLSLLLEVPDAMTILNLVKLEYFIDI